MRFKALKNNTDVSLKFTSLVVFQWFSRIVLQTLLTFGFLWILLFFERWDNIRQYLSKNISKNILSFLYGFIL